MLRTRVITALWLAPLALGAIFALPPRAFSLFLAAVLLLGAVEFRRLAGLTGWSLPGLQAALFGALWLAPSAWMPAAPGILLAICAAWLAMFLRLATFRPGRPVDGGYRSLSFICALAVLTGAWVSLGWLHSQPRGSWWILALLLIIWSADTAAYFAGRAFGKRKLAPHLSPGKTVAGLVGGLVAAAGIGWLAITTLPTGAQGAPGWIIVAAATALASAGGDLFISMHKRTTGVKDSGRVFPGHGGILDRLDSLLAGAPFFALGLWLVGRG